MTPDDSADDLQVIAAFLSLSGRLKSLKRQGWVDRGVEQPESVADHSWRLALATLVLGSRDPEIDLPRAIVLALVHDLPEALAGDITPFDTQLGAGEIDREALFRRLPEYSEQADLEKTAAERRALTELVADLPDDLAGLLTDAWEEYEAGATPEARLVRQLDKLETWLQALEYRNQQPELIIESFRLGTLRDVDEPGLEKLLEAITGRFERDRDPE